MIRPDTARIEIAVFSARNRNDQSNTAIPQVSSRPDQIQRKSAKRLRSALLVNQIFYGLGHGF
jgi:hypothetical protein